MQDELEQGHVQYGYRISWPSGHAINFAQGSASLNSTVEAINRHFQYHKNRLERDCRNKNEDEVRELVTDFIAQAFANLSIETFIELHIYDDFKTRTICSYIGAPTETTPEEITDSLKRISYDYFRRFADKVKREIENIYTANLNNRSMFRASLDREGQKVQVMHLPLMINLVRDAYIAEGVYGSFVTDYEH